MTFSQLINEYPLVLVEFFASWCPHCQKMMPIVEEVKEQLQNVPVAQLDIEQNNQAAREAGANTVPTFIIYANGQEVWRYSGEIEGNELLARVQSFL